MDINPISINYEWTNDVEIAKRWLSILSTKEMFAADFEAASHYDNEQLEKFNKIISDNSISYLVRKEAQSCIASTPLDFPSHVDITHLSVAWSDRDAYVFVLDSFEITQLVLDFLITTEIKQIWHNACYDFRLIYYFTGKMPKNYEDTQIYAKTLFNHVDVHKANTGLKDLAGTMYGDWGLSKESFTKAEMYEEYMLKYSAIDSCATFWVYLRILSNVDDADVVYPDTLQDYSPWEQLPARTPKGAVYGESYFYHKTAKWLVRDTVRLMINGLPINLAEVQKLEENLEGIIQDVETRLANNPLVVAYIKQKQEELKTTYVSLQYQKMKSPEDFYKPFDHKNILHRSVYMKLFAEYVGISAPEEEVHAGIPKWSVALVRKFVPQFPALKHLLDGNMKRIQQRADAAATLIAQMKADMYNTKYLALVEQPKLKELVFNPSSPKQKQELFAMIGLDSDEQSRKTGEDSWSREQIERVNKETEDDDIREFTQTLIDYSYAAIVRNNFVQSFYRYSVDNRLHGSYKLLGAKSCRYTSSNPNMLNAPSSGSIFAKPIKKCFIAPKGFIVGAIDYAALEDRVMANLSEDTNKLNVFLKGVDGHSLAALYYWPASAQSVLEDLSDTTDAALRFKVLVDDGNIVLKELRNRGKRISFGLAYGAFPPKVAKSAKLPLAEATQIFNSYHNEMYPGVTDYRENYVLKTAHEQGYIHLGLGARMYTDNPTNDIRTLNNGTCQFWSILTAIAINKIHQMIDKEGKQDDIFVTSTIYDSIYFIFRDNPETVKWINDLIVPVMEKDFMENQIVHNSVDLEIGPSWAELHRLPHNASLEEIQKVRSAWK